MIKNYFILNRIALELNSLLNGFKIIGFFSQEKDRAILELEKQGTFKFIEISVNTGLPFIIVRDDFRRAKKNTINLFPWLLFSVIRSVSISNTDRIIKIELTEGSVYFTIRGKHTNIVTISSDHQIHCFKKEDETFVNDFKKEIGSHSFITFFNVPEFESSGNSLTAENIKRDYPFIGKEILFENKIRTGNGNDLQSIKMLLEEIECDSFRVFVDDNTGSVKLSFSSFKQFPYTDSHHFDSVLDALNLYLPLKFKLEKELSNEKILKRHLDLLAQRLSTKLNKLKIVFDRESRDEEYQNKANILLINIHLIKPGMKEIELQNIYTGNTNIIIKLDPSKSPRKNVDNYFEKSRSEKIKRAKSRELFEKTKTEFEVIREKIIELENEISPQRIKQLMDEFKIKPKNQTEEKDDLRSKFKKYIIDNKYFIYVGRDSRNNDLLTMKFAKQNDYWFHARSVPGSHVVLKVDNSKENVPKDVLKRTASIAAYHSKAKTSGMVPVSYTQKKNVYKKKGMEAGKVALMKEEVLIVKPGIHAGCEFIEQD